MVLFILVAGFVMFVFPILFNYPTPIRKSLFFVLKAFGFAIDRDKYVYLIAILNSLGYVIGSLVLTCSESTLAVCTYYVCGLFKITRYRIHYVKKKKEEKKPLSQKCAQI